MGKGGAGVKNTLKLSNYLFSWFFHKYERYILGISLAISMVLLLIMGDFDNKNIYEHLATEFRTYDLIVDYSGVGFVFLLGLITLFVTIFVQINSYYTNGKGMYSIFTLPMKRHEIFCAFFFSALTAVMFYFAVWLVVMLIFYFPLTSMYERAASEAVLYISEDVTLRDLDSSITNGLFLAFQRSTFLSVCFPTSWIQGLALCCGMFLSTIAVVFAGLYNEYVSMRVGLFLIVLGGFFGAFYRAWMAFEYFVDYSIKKVMPESLYFSITALLVGILLFIAAIRKLKRRKDI